MEQNFNHVLLCGQVLTPSRSRPTSTTARASPGSCCPSPGSPGRRTVCPVIVPQPLLELCPLSPGAAVTVTGQLRSFNNRSGQGPRLVVSGLCPDPPARRRGAGESHSAVRRAL